jgi:hypothetical protein
MMIKAIIIDDEEDGREALKLALGKFCPEIEIIGIYGSSGGRSACDTRK